MTDSKRQSPKKRITNKLDKQIVSSLIENPNISQVANNLKISRSTIYNRIAQNQTIQECLNTAGITDDYLAAKHKSLIESTRPLYNPKTQEFQDVPDNNARNAAISLAYKVKGHLKENIENQQNIQINIIKYGDKVEGKSENSAIDADFTSSTKQQAVNA